MSVSPEDETNSSGKWGEGERNIILWADHRAEEEAKEINKTGDMVLNYVGGTMSVSRIRAREGGIEERWHKGQRPGRALT